MLQNFHMPSPMLKSTYEKVWDMEEELLRNVSSNRTRTNQDVNQYIMSYYNIATGNFVPKGSNDGKYYEIGKTDEILFADILGGRHKFICINDNEDIDCLDSSQEKLIEIFEKKFPQKSSFEL